MQEAYDFSGLSEDAINELEEFVYKLEGRRMQKKATKKEEAKSAPSSLHTNAIDSRYTSPRTSGNKKMDFSGLNEESINDLISFAERVNEQIDDFETVESIEEPYEDFGNQRDYATLATTLPTSETRPMQDTGIPKGHEKYGRLDKTDAEVEKIADEISRNINKQIKREERKAKKAQKAENRRISKPKELTRERFTEPKKRLLISRIHLINKYDRGSYSDIKRWIKKGELTFEEVEEYRTSKSWFDRSLYKEVREYEDVMDDVKLRRGWRTFKAGIGAVMLAACIALPTAYIDKYTNLNPTTSAPITYEVADETSKEQARNLIESIKETSGYDFANLSEIQMIDTVLRMPTVIDKTQERSFYAASMRFEDQKKLDHILYVGLGETYADFTYEQKLELRQLTYELIGTMGEDGLAKQKWLRSPMKVEELIANYNLVSKGELPSKGGVANPGAVAGYGVTSGWNGEKAIIKRDKTGGIVIEYVTHNFQNIGEATATTETISSDNTINNDQVTNNDEMDEERI